MKGNFVRAAFAVVMGAFATVAAADGPKLLEYRGGYSILGNRLGVSGLVAADLDGDGRHEIVVAGTTLTFGGPGLVTVLTADQSAAAGYRELSFTEPYAAGVSAIAALDLDEDGAAEVLIGLEDGSIDVRGGSHLAPVAGALVSAAGGVRKMILADADNDGATDLVVLGEAAITLLDPRTLASRGSVGQGASDLAIGDVDGDGANEVVLNTGAVLRLSRSGPDLDTTSVWNYPGGSFGIHVALADIDADGIPELIAESDWEYLTAFDLDLQAPKWQINQLDDLSAMTLADVNRDGVPDAILGNGQWGNVTAIDLVSRQTLWSVSNPDSGTGAVLIADVDDDGANELLWTAGYDSSGADHMYVYSLPTRVEKWHTQHIDGPFAAIAVQQGDGTPDSARVAFASSRSDSNFTDGIVMQWNAATLQPLTASEPRTFHGFAVTGIHALCYAADESRQLFVGTDRLYNGALYALDEAIGALDFEHVYDSGSPIYSLASGDFDGDGRAEIVWGSGVATSGSPGIYVAIVDALSGEELWRSIALGVASLRVAGIALGDLDGDGLDDIAAVATGYASGHLFQFVGPSHLQWESDEDIYTAITTFDIDGDGVAEVMAGTADGSVRVLDARTHAILTTIPIADDPIDAVRAYADPRNGRVRIATLADGYLRVHALWRRQWIATAPERIDGARALEALDIDGDNKIDFFVGGTASFRVYRLPDDVIFDNGFD